MQGGPGDLGQLLRVPELGPEPAGRNDGLASLAEECVRIVGWIPLPLLDSLDRRVRSSQERRRLVADALSTGTITQWDIPGGYISTGDDFWTTIERARRA